jgi:hypothetical protein
MLQCSGFGQAPSFCFVSFVWEIISVHLDRHVATLSVYGKHMLALTFGCTNFNHWQSRRNLRWQAFEESPRPQYLESLTKLLV